MYFLNCITKIQFCNTTLFYLTFISLSYLNICAEYCNFAPLETLHLLRSQETELHGLNLIDAFALWLLRCIQILGYTKSCEDRRRIRWSTESSSSLPAGLHTFMKALSPAGALFPATTALSSAHNRSLQPGNGHSSPSCQLQGTPPLFINVPSSVHGSVNSLCI